MRAHLISGRRVRAQHAPMARRRQWHPDGPAAPGLRRGPPL